ncbi:hypothetical protein BH11BAC1_BH11BAC1_24060 [soil metagenome]
MDKEFRYFQFPLCLVEGIIIDPNAGINNIISFAIVNFAKNCKYTLYDVCRQLMYDFYRSESKIPSALKKKLQVYVRDEVLTENEDYNGFDGSGDFNPEDNIEELQNIFNTDAEFKQQAILHYQVHCTCKFLGISIGSINGTHGRHAEVVKKIQLQESKYGKQPMPGMKKDVMFEFRDKINPNEIELLGACIAVRSIIGQKTFSPTYKSVIQTE